MIVTFIPAAGSARRMGGSDKLLETIHREPILARTARIAVEVGIGPVLVGLRPDDKNRRDALGSLDVHVVDVPDADEGMAAGLRMGARAALERAANVDHEFFGMMVLLPDMPEITEADLARLGREFQAAGGRVVRATNKDGLPGHPTILPVHVLRKVETLKGDIGAAALLDGEKVHHCQLPGQRARLDLDTPEDWAAWRKATGVAD